jgi:hypothetical protein
MAKSKLFSNMYFALAIVGLCATWYYNLQYFAQGGTEAFSLYLKNALANLVTTGITVDIYFSAFIFSAWALRESARIHLKNPFIYIILSFSVGLAFALPLFLAFRELKMMQNNQ